MFRSDKKRAWLALWATVGLMAACGGGGGDDSPSPTPPPSSTPSPTPPPPPAPPPPAPPPPTPPPPVSPASISGLVTVLDISVVDSDTNDPLQQQRAGNNEVATAQPAGNPALAVGYVNEAGQGPDGPNKTAGDVWDAYRVDLVAGQVVELNFGDADAADVDLYLFDTNGENVGESIGVTRSECIRITRSGTYLVGVNAFEGASAYELAWGPARPNSTCANSSTAAGFVADELIAKPLADATGAAGKTSAPAYAKAHGMLDRLGIARKATSAPGDMTLLGLPSSDDGRRKLEAGLAAMRVPAGTSLMKAAVRAPLGGTTDAAARAFATVNAAKQLAASGAFAYVELNRRVHSTQVGYGVWPPNDEYLSRQPHYGLIDLPEAFGALQSLSPRPTYTPIVAVVDTGIVADHPDLSRMLVPGYDFVRSTSISGDGDGIDSNPNDEGGSSDTFHGTHVAGTIAAEGFNGSGVTGVAPMARIMAVRVLGVGGSGSTYDVLQGIRYAAGLSNDAGRVPDRRADVINLSLGSSNACSSAQAETITAARGQGAIVVVAAGNEAAPVGAPANCAGAVAVSAVSYDLRLATYSNSGPEIIVAAPGGDQQRSSPAGADTIFSTYAAFSGGTRRPNYTGLQGTSMATPHVAGVMALMRAVNPSITPAQVDALFASGALTNDLGSTGRDSSFGYGLVSAVKAVSAAAGSGSTPVPVPNLPTLAINPAVLDFGTSLTQLEITLTRINSSTDTPQSFRSTAIDPAAISIAAVSGNTEAGPFRYTVGVDRARLTPGENVIRVEIVSAQGKSVPFDVSVAARASAPVGMRGVGPVYVLAADVNTLANVGQANVTSVGLTYPYTISAVTAAQVVVVAGTDTDNDGFICSASEPCGLYPVIGGQPVILEMAAGNRTGIDFQLVSGGASAASLSAGATVLRPAKGFQRVMP